MATHDLSSLTKVYTGGAPTPPGVLDDWHARTGARIQPMYGLTEATSPTHMTPHGVVPPIDPQTGAMSIGVPVFNTDVSVVTDAGPRRRAARDRRVRDRRPADHPGLLAEAEGDGRSRCATAGCARATSGSWTSRAGSISSTASKDMIVASGFKVWPREVEEVLYLHPGRARGRRRRHARRVSRRDDQGRHQPEARPSKYRPRKSRRSRASGWPRTSTRASSRSSTTCRRRRAARSCAGCCSRTASASAMPRASRARRRVVSAAACGARGARRARSRRRVAAPQPRRRRRCRPSAALYERLRLMLAQLRRRRPVRRPRRVLRGQRGVSRGGGRPGGERAPVAWASGDCACASCSRRRSRTRPSRAENVVYFHEYLTDSIAAGDAAGAVKAILSWGKHVASGVRGALGARRNRPAARRAAARRRSSRTCRSPWRRSRSSLAGDVDALVLALDARAALEIGITQSLGDALSHRGRARCARRAPARVHAARARHRRRARVALHPRRRRVPSRVLQPAAQSAAVRHLQRDGSCRS